MFVFIILTNYCYLLVGNIRDQLQKENQEFYIHLQQFSFKKIDVEFCNYFCIFHQ